MNRKVFTIGILILGIISCAENTRKNTEERIEVIHEQSIQTKDSSRNEELRETIQNLQDLNEEQEKSLRSSQEKSVDVIKEKANDDQIDLQNTINDLKKLNDSMDKS